jgi:hypothetical protein
VKRTRKPDFWLGWLLLLVGLPCLAWGNWPLSRTAVVDLAISPQEIALPGGEGGSGQPAPEDGRRLLVIAPTTLRLGDDAVIEATLEPLPQESPAGDPDLYLTHNLVAEARLEATGLLVAPGGEVYSTLRDGLPTAFTWNIRPAAAGQQTQTLWLHAQFIPEPDPLEKVFPERKLLAAPEFQVKVVSFLGLAGTPARVVGGVCTVLGAVLLLWPLLLRGSVRLLGASPQDGGETHA